MNEVLTTRLFMIALTFLGVLSITLGLSFFRSSLSISTNLSEIANYRNFNVDFSKNSDIEEEAVATGDIIPQRNVEGFTATPAVIDNIDDPRLKNISITFNEPGQALNYSLYASNLGDTTAYLKSITLSNVKDEYEPKICFPIENTTRELVEEACKDITIEMEAGSSGIQTGSITGIRNHILAPKKSEKININITYKANAQRTDGPFQVLIGDISLLYSPID